MVSSDDLFGFLTDEAQTPSWSRAPAKFSPVGAEFSLFGVVSSGNTYWLILPIALCKAGSLRVQPWSNDHEGTLTAMLDQQADSTKLVMELSGVPKGQEEEIEWNLTGY
ncbi:hypothetical protein BS47DRAFT_1342782 [Hydnum rufescens UP504]|uniref:Activator of Hsp90 ATPase homologue 1/2-like C-terminal domain-containing protein n=1 Tax=Hydnum rufescens UP504 TaxID=1448309 RepID=A0A9P6DXI4_9AGAM|nr:hypothetical protein BS47DRAFT_1342782 [Hydnum rufescens UP504]